MVAIGLTSALFNNRMASNSELGLCTNPARVMSNLESAASGQVPLFAAHQAENNLMSQKLLSEAMLPAYESAEKSSEKMAKENIRKSFSIIV